MKNFIDIEQVSREEIDMLLDLAGRVKANPEVYADRMKNRTLGLIFEKPSTRTWASFHVGMSQMGGGALYFGPQDIALGKREEVRDIARVLAGYLDGVVLRTFSHQTIEEFAKYCGKPVINGLSDYSHPCQAMADFMTLRENFGAQELSKLKLVYLGDANNVLRSLLFMAAKLGAHFWYATPKAYSPAAGELKTLAALAKKSGAKIHGTHNPKEAAKGAHMLYTDVWVSMGEDTDETKKKKALAPFQINQSLLKLAAHDAVVLHCLPAHRGEEITAQVMDGKKSRVFQQAENRLHAQKAILLHLLVPSSI